jgi:cytochrome P450
VEKTQHAFTGFSMGPRGCIGRNMAYLKMMTTMTRVVFQFDMNLTSRIRERSPNLGWLRQGVFYLL